MDSFLAIKNALKQENLNPEIEEKLLQLQRYQEKQMKHEPGLIEPPVSPTVISKTSLRKRPLSSSSKSVDEDWIETIPRKRPPRNCNTQGTDRRAKYVL